MTLTHLFTTLKGGARSGNFGHAGRPGYHGGSAPKGLGHAETYDSIKSTFKRVPPYIFEDAQDYIEEAYMRVNHFLRGDELSQGDEFGDKEKEQKSVHRIIQSMDEYTKSYSLPTETSLYRRIKNSQAENIRTLIAVVKPGEKLPKIKIFQSATLEREYAPRFGERISSETNKTILEITNKKAKKVGLGTRWESEIILPRNVVFTYQGQRVEDGNLFVQLEY